MLGRSGSGRLVKVRSGKTTSLEKLPLADLNARSIIKTSRMKEGQSCPANCVKNCVQNEERLIVLTVRPKVTEMSLQLFGRSVHPELFVTLQSRRIERGGYILQVDITNAGHVIAFRHESLTLTEVACASGQLLPTDRRLMLYRIRGERSDKIEHRGITYQTSIQLEPVSPELFVLFQQELAREGERQGMLQRFDSSTRVPTGAISYINTETRNRTVLIQAFHTFPDECAIVKSQSVFRLP